MDIILAEIAKVASTFGIAWFSFWGAIPAGLALGLHPIAIIIITSLSYLSGILIVILPAKSVRDWVMKRFGKNMNLSDESDSFFMRMWRKYGVIGFGLIAPMTTGAQLGAIIGTTLDIPRKQLILWMFIGVVVWAIGLTILAVAGVELLTTPS